MVILTYFFILQLGFCQNIVPKDEGAVKLETKASPPNVENLLKNYALYNDSEFNLASSLPLTGGVGLAGTDVSLGLNLVFNRVNRAGGIKKKLTTKLFVLDDHYQAELTRKNILGLYPKTRLSLAAFGPDALNSLREEIKVSRVAAIFPLGGEGAFRSRKNKYCENVIFYRAPQHREISVLLHYAVRKMLRHKIAIFYEDSHFGEQGLRNAEITLAKLGLKIIAKASYPKNTLGIMAAVKQLSAQTPDAILCIAHSYPAYNFIQQIVNEGFSACLFLGLGELTPIQQIISRSRGIKLVLSSCVPSPAAEIDVAKQYREAMQKDLPIKELSPFGFEGYICAKILMETLEELSDTATLEELFTSFSKIDKDWGGIKLKYNPKTKSLCNTVWLNEGPGGTWLTDTEVFAIGSNVSSEKEKVVKKTDDSNIVVDSKAATPTVVAEKLEKSESKSETKKEASSAADKPTEKAAS